MALDRAAGRRVGKSDGRYLWKATPPAFLGTIFIRVIEKVVDLTVHTANSIVRFITIKTR